MLTDPVAIEIIANAKQKNVRDPNRSRKHFENIFSDYLSRVEFSGDYLDMGPGQYDFGVMALERGADRCFAIENDPPVIALGEYLKFDVIEGNIKNFSADMVANQQFSGIFNKFSYNCFWYIGAEEKHRDFVEALRQSLVDGGWAWIAPWNGVPKNQDLSSADIEKMLSAQIELFVAQGFEYREINQMQARKYGIHGTIANNIIFTLGL